ncbi:acetate uptake transporter [uncultured Mucilaginibacter sp.]|uniref:acetate uptake transporter n=1 Tax=uncultured Mucilaginibacter sp. TaxID=797541 RepID=UPI0025FE8980|nr:acetate uptake transporter [uncultured Mucilaginibacter sp.]
MIPTTPVPAKDGIANPAPLGLCAFGMTTVLLNLHNAGFYELNTMILAMGIFYGGLAQVIAGVIESKKNNTFGLTAFTSYGFFWLSLAGLILMGKWGWFTAPSDGAMAAYLGIWGLFTLGLFFGTLKLTRALQIIFGTLVILFFLLAAEHATGNESIGKFAGYEGLVCGFSAIYAGIATVLNDVYGKTVLPLG